MSDLQLLTLQIVEGRISVDQARALVIAKAKMIREMRELAAWQQRRKKKVAA